MPKRDKIWESKVSIRQIDMADIAKCIKNLQHWNHFIGLDRLDHSWILVDFYKFLVERDDMAKHPVR